MTTDFPATSLTGILAGPDGLAVDEDGAGAAIALAAAVFRPGQPEVGPQDPEQGALAVDVQADGFSVESEREEFGHRDLRKKDGIPWKSKN